MLNQQKIKVDNKLDKEQISEIKSKIYYVNNSIEKVSFNKKDNIFVMNLNKNIKKTNINKIKTHINKVIKQVSEKSIKFRQHIKFYNNQKKKLYKKNPLKELIKRGEVCKEASGYYSFSKNYSKLMTYFDKQIIKVAQKFSSKEFHFPSLIPQKFLRKINYIENFPHSLCFACNLEENFENMESLITKSKHKNKNFDIPLNYLSNTKTMLSPTVCQHLYLSLSKKIIKENFSATAIGNCFRYESKNFNSLERLFNFTMREIIIIGTENYVNKNLEKLELLFKKILNDLELSYSFETANDSFFTSNQNDLINFQRTYKLKYEIRANLPYNNSSLAVGSFNNSQNFFGQKLSIKLKNGEYIHSGCIGFGFERLVFSLFCQKGFKISHWPPKLIKILNFNE